MKKTLLTLISVCCFLLLFAAAASAAVHGDVDANGEVDVTDARYALRAAVGLENYAADSLSYYTADVDASGEIDVSDARTILRAAVGLENLDAFHNWSAVYENGLVQPTCTQGIHADKTCRICGGTATEDVPALGHDLSALASAADPAATVKCARCGAEIPSFNSLVNELKLNTHLYSGFVYSSSKGTIKGDPKINISLAAKIAAAAAGEKLDKETLLSQLTQEMAQASEGYNSYVGAPQVITDRNFEVAGEAYVSALTAADIVSITVEDAEGVDFIASLPDTLTISSAYGNQTFTQDISQSVKAAKIGAVKKVTVKLKEEKYSKIKGSTSETALQRGMGYDLRALADELNHKEDQDGMLFEMKCNEATSNGTITYYFDSETLMPVAATYDMTVNCDQSIIMDAKVGGISMMSGNINVGMDNKSVTYYFFDGRFEPKA